MKKSRHELAAELRQAGVDAADMLEHYAQKWSAANVGPHPGAETCAVRWDDDTRAEVRAILTDPFEVLANAVGALADVVDGLAGRRVALDIGAHADSCPKCGDCDELEQLVDSDPGPGSARTKLRTLVQSPIGVTMDEGREWPTFRFAGMDPAALQDPARIAELLELALSLPRVD